MTMKFTIILWICIFHSLNAVDENLEVTTFADSPQRQGLSLFPQNEAVMPGSSTTFTCWADAPSPHSRIRWIEYTRSGSDGSIISDGGDVLPNHPERARYAIVHDDPLQFDLRISDIVMMDGGSYRCEDINDPMSSRYRAQAELVVHDDHPNCNPTIPSDGIVLEGDHYAIECTIGYKGNIAPSMSWTGPQPYYTIDGPNAEGSQWYNFPKVEIKNSLEDIDKVSSRLWFYVYRDQDGGAFECITNFTSLGFDPYDFAAVNLPTYSHLYRSNQLHVFWSPKNKYVYPSKYSYDYGDVVQCFADAKPAAAFYWRNTRTGEVTVGDIFRVTYDFVGHTTVMICNMENSFGGKVYSDTIYISFYVSDPYYYDDYYRPHHLSAGAIAGIVIGSLIAAVLVIGIGFRLFRKRSRNENNNKKSSGFKDLERRVSYNKDSDDKVKIVNDFETPSNDNPDSYVTDPLKAAATLVY